MVLVRKTTKEKILYTLKKDDEMSIKEILAHFTISEVAIRRHLNDLIRQKLVKERVVKQDIGRPFHLYALTSKGHETFPNHYPDMPVELLQDLESLKGKEVVNELLMQRVNREEETLGEKMKDASFDKKVALMADIQETKGYMIEYEKLPDGDYEVKNYNCPIYNVASNYRQVCHYEKNMMRNVFPDSEVKPGACMTYGDQYCCWYISKPKSSGDE